MARTYVFICINRRDAAARSSSCGQRGSPELVERAKAIVRDRGLKGVVRVSSSGCLGECEHGIAALIEPLHAVHLGITEASLEAVLDSCLAAAPSGPDSAEPRRCDHRSRQDDG